MLEQVEPLATTAGAYVFAVVLGLLFGSFANVCIYRLPPTEEFPEGRSIVKPGSHCFACKQPIRWYDNVPLLAWLWLRGKCRNCGATFSARYLIVEALTGALFGFAWWITVVAPVLWQPFDQRLLHFAIAAAFVFVMVVITFIDLDTFHIYDKITLPCIPLFYLASLLLPERRWYDGLIGIAVGYGVVELLFQIWMRLRKVEAIGGGDAKLLAVVGALLGWPGVVAALSVGSMLGVVVIFPPLLVKQMRARREAEAAGAVSAPSARFSVRWWLIGTAIAFAINALGAYAVSLAGSVAIEPLLALLIGSSVIGGLYIGRRSDGIVMLEASLAGLVAAALFSFVPVTSTLHGLWHQEPIRIVLALSVPLVAALLGGFVGERLRQRPDDAIEDSPDHAEEENPSLLHTQLPFGPFLAAGAVLYLFAEPWFQLNFRLGV